jgi:transposase
MRSKGTEEELARRRKQGLKLLEQGKSPKEVSELLDLKERSVRRWRQEAKSPRKKSGRPPGRPIQLTGEQIQRLEQELLHGAYAHGYAEDYWTLERIGHLIWELFGARYVPSGVWHLMDRMGWSNQKLQRLAIQRDEEVIVSWKRRVWPRIKKVARVVGHAGL